MAMKFVITGSDTGKPKLVGSHQFDSNGEYTYAGDPAAVGSLIKYFATFNAYLIGSAEYDAAIKRDKEYNHGRGQSSTSESGRKADSGVSAVGDGSGPSGGPTDPALAEVKDGAKGSGEAGGRVALPKSDDPEVMDLQDAVLALDSATDEHWNEEGLPRINAVEEIAKKAGVTRKQIEDAAPGYNRDAAMKNALADV